MSGVIAPLLVLLALAWVALVVSAPLLPAAPAGILYALASQICHQISERSFHLGASQLPICARCLGIYVGFAGGLVLATFATLSRRVRGSDPGTTRHRGLTPLMVVTIGAFPTVITVLAEWGGVWQTSNLTRAIAGAPLGLAVALVVIAALATRGGLHYGECAPRPPIAPDRPPSHI